MARHLNFFRARLASQQLSTLLFADALAGRNVGAPALMSRRLREALYAADCLLAAESLTDPRSSASATPGSPNGGPNGGPDPYGDGGGYPHVAGDPDAVGIPATVPTCEAGSGEAGESGEVGTDEPCREPETYCPCAHCQRRRDEAAAEHADAAARRLRMDFLKRTRRIDFSSASDALPGPRRDRGREESGEGGND